MRTEPGGPPPEPQPADAWSPGRRRAVTALLLLHLTALMIAPLAVPPTSPLFLTVRTWVRPYVEAAFLDHGYKFFAPEPGPSHLIRYVVTRSDGTRREGLFPSRDEHRPRLFYHRHFMLSEFVNSLAPTGEDSPLSQAYARSYAQHLLAVHEGAEVKLYLRRHELPSAEAVAEGMRLDDARLYRERALGVYQRETP